MKKHHEQSITRFPRLRHDIWKGIPRFDPSKVKPSRWLIDFFLAQGCTQLIFGSYGTRKTTAMLVASWAVSRGKPFLGRKTRKRHVLYLDFENPADVLKSYCDDLGIDPLTPGFTIWDRTATNTVPLPGDPILTKFVERCKKLTGHAPWIIFDSWTSLLKAGDSGDKIGEATPIFRAIRQLCDMGATCTIIDHTGHRGKHAIGTSAKSTQMDSSHHFELIGDENTLVDSESSRSVVRVKSFLKRYTPKGVGTFSIEVKAARDKKQVWHTTSFEPTKDRAVLKLEAERESMQRLVAKNPKLGKEALSKLADQKGIMSRDRARQMLQDGIGKYWESIDRGRRKQTFRVLKSSSTRVRGTL